MRRTVSKVSTASRPVNVAGATDLVSFQSYLNGRYQLPGAVSDAAITEATLLSDYFGFYYSELQSGLKHRFFVVRQGADRDWLPVRELKSTLLERLATNGSPASGKAIQFEGQLGALRHDEKIYFVWFSESGAELAHPKVVTLTASVNHAGSAIESLAVKEEDKSGVMTAVTVGNAVFAQNRVTVDVDLTTGNADASEIDLVLKSSGTIVARQRLAAASTISTVQIGNVDLPLGPQDLQAQLYRGRNLVASSPVVRVDVLPSGPVVDSVDPSGFSLAQTNVIKVQFQRSIPVDPDSAVQLENYSLTNTASVDGKPSPEKSPTATPVFDAAQNSVEIQFSRDLAPGTYIFTVKSATLTNVLGQKLVDKDGTEKDYTLRITKNTSSEFPTTVAGLDSHYAGAHVEFPEYTPPRNIAKGFNPSDKVVTRVARLYYFRDAHRVTQIVNRKAKSYNRAAVQMQQQFADTARRQADAATVDRRELEQQAVRAAQEARLAENTLEEHQQALIRARDAAGRLEADIEQLDTLIADLNAGPAGDGQTEQDREKRLRDVQRLRDSKDTDLDRAELQVLQQEALVRNLLSTIQAKRENEIRLTERWEAAEQEERLKAEEQFRREVAAKTADPDTYAPANPRSDDPVTQVSLSVVGEGLIQMRGPRKGVNEVHKIINQLDAPVGQVKVAIHTVQVNGERGERMEKVVNRIQRYLDHSRFLTIQSTQMLRNAVVKVASRRADAIADICPPGTPQQVRDFKYQQAFFGQDFIQELQSLDSEFLQTGNKVLSLNSMDTTSLSNALFLMSLAKNDVREEILQEFMNDVLCKLPQDEVEFFEQSGAEFKYRHKQFQFLGHNAKFTALRGFFDAQVAGSDTLNPMQREFIRLAQIFKARLITEVELRQRVMERALIEERIGDSQAAAVEAKKREDEAKEKLRNAQWAVYETAEQVRATLVPIQSTIQGILEAADQASSRASDFKRLQTELIRGFIFKWLVAANDRVRPDSAEIERAEKVLFGPSRNGTYTALRTRYFGLALVRKSNPSTWTTAAAWNQIEMLAPTLTQGPVAEVRRDQEQQDSGAARMFSDVWNVLSSRQPPERTAEINDTVQYLIKSSENPPVSTDDKSLPEHSGFSIPFKFNEHKYVLKLDPPQAGRVSDGFQVDDWKQLWRDIESYVEQFETMKRRLGQYKHRAVEHSLMLAADDMLRRVAKLEQETTEVVDKTGAGLTAIYLLSEVAYNYQTVGRRVITKTTSLRDNLTRLRSTFSKVAADPNLFDDLLNGWVAFKEVVMEDLDPHAEGIKELGTGSDGKHLNRFDVAQGIIFEVDRALGIIQADKAAENALLAAIANLRTAEAAADGSRRKLDHKKFLDMLVDDVEEKFIELVEGTRAQTSNIDNYLKRLGTALEDDVNAQFYHPAFRHVRETSYFYDVNVGQVETTSVVANNRMFAKVSPQATMEFDLPKRDILINEAMNSALAAYNDYGALMGDPNFLALMKMYGGQSPSTTYGGLGQSPYIQEVLPGLPSTTDAQFMSSANNNVPRIGSNLEALIPDPAIYKFETGTGYEIRPVIQPDGQSVVFHFDYMYTTNVREPVRADEKHLGRVKRHFINTDVVSGNYELREVSTYQVGLKASRTSRGVPLLEDAPGIGVLFRPLPSDESSLQQNIILSHTVIYPTLFDLMGLRWAPAVADLDSLSLREREFVTRHREKFLQNEVFDYSSLQVDDFMRIPEAERRGDLYRTQESIPHTHPNGYHGSGLNIRNGHLQEGYAPEQFHPQSQYVPQRSEDARFSLETAPATPVLKVPSVQSLKPRRPGFSDGFVPGTDIPIDSLEGAIPLDPQYAPGQSCPPDTTSPDYRFRSSTHGGTSGDGDAKPLLQSSFQQPNAVPTLQMGSFCRPVAAEQASLSAVDPNPPLTQIHQRSRPRFSRDILGLPGRLIKGLTGRGSESPSDPVRIGTAQTISAGTRASQTVD
ncbi:MAG: hypothetical protein RIK87_30690 [Fuerstiella sp.]